MDLLHLNQQIADEYSTYCALIHNTFTVSALQRYIPLDGINDTDYKFKKVCQKISF
jgi:hypothetical protein